MQQQYNNYGNYGNPTPQQVYYQRPKTNGLGTAGFICALLALILCWAPVLDWILWVLGFVFSIIGLFKAPRGLAIAGFIISIIGIIILLVLVAGFLGLAMLSV